MRALVVEDDKSVREATTMLLHCAGIEACAVATGEEAIDLEPKGAFDVVLLDVGLPGIDGFEVCRRVRRVSQTPIVVLTARTGIEDLVTALELGADDYVVKPFRREELVARVRRILERTYGKPSVASAAAQTPASGPPATDSR
jgi:DNA-binding response OmpR family regulator